MQNRCHPSATSPKWKISDTPKVTLRGRPPKLWLDNIKQSCQGLGISSVSKASNMASNRTEWSTMVKRLLAQKIPSTRANWNGLPAKYWLRSTWLKFDSVPQLFQLSYMYMYVPGQVNSTHVLTHKHYGEQFVWTLLIPTEVLHWPLVEAQAVTRNKNNKHTSGDVARAFYASLFRVAACVLTKARCTWVEVFIVFKIYLHILQFGPPNPAGQSQVPVTGSHGAPRWHVQAWEQSGPKRPASHPGGITRTTFMSNEQTHHV